MTTTTSAAASVPSTGLRSNHPLHHPATTTTTTTTAIANDILSYQPCICILPTSNLAHHGKALQSIKNQSDHCFILDTTGQGTYILYDLSNQTMTAKKKIPIGFLNEASLSSEHEKNCIVFLKSRYIFLVGGNHHMESNGTRNRNMISASSSKAFDLVRQIITRVPWGASTLAQSTVGCTVLQNDNQGTATGAAAAAAATTATATGNNTNTISDHAAIYVIGGRDKTNRCMRSDVQYFSSSSQTWHTITPSMTIARRNAAAVTIGNKLYVIGGLFWDVFKARYRECPYTEIFDGTQWTFGPSLNTPRQKHCAVVIGNSSIVVLGGETTSSSSSSSATPTATSNVEDVEIWNIGTNYFASFPSALSPSRSNFDAIVYRGQEIFLIGGGTRAIGKLTIDSTKLTPEKLCYWSPAVDAEAPPIERRIHEAAADTKLPPKVMAQGGATGEQSTKRSIQHYDDARSIHGLPHPPPLPQPPIAMTLYERHKAMSSYIEKLMQAHENYSKAIQQTKDDIQQHYDRIQEYYTKLCHEEMTSIQNQAAVWLKDTEKIIQQAVDDAQLVKEQLESKNLSSSTPSESKMISFLKQNDHDEFFDDIPSQLRCPLTLDIMTDPVVAADGNTYERSALEDWFQNCKLQHKQQQQNYSSDTKYTPRSPLTGAELPNESFFPVHTLRSMCLQYAKQMETSNDNEQDE